jgi:hypothetical protein
MKFTMAKLATAIRKGCGTGTGNSYKPWIQVTRRTSSPCSNLNVVPVPYLTRLTHFLSRGEREFALYLWWLGALDIREQFPLWPWRHLHPNVQIGCRDGTFHEGMEEVARDAGIPLYCYPGLDVPWVHTIDMLVTVPVATNAARLVGISCKPRDILVQGAPTDRELERLELDRRYCAHASIPYRVAHPEEITKLLLVQLHWLAPIESSATLLRLTQSLQYQVYVEYLDRTAYDRPAWIASREAGKHVGWSKQIEQRAMKIALWYQHVDVDVSRPILTTRPLIAGGRAIRECAANRWLRGGA